MRVVPVPEVVNSSSSKWASSDTETTELLCSYSLRRDPDDCVDKAPGGVTNSRWTRWTMVLINGREGHAAWSSEKRRNWSLVENSGGSA